MYMQIRMPLACLLILSYTFILSCFKRRFQTITSRVFESLEIAGIVHVFAAVVTEYTVNNRDSVPFLFNHIWHIIFLVSLSVACAMLYLYVLLYVERSTGIARSYAKRALTIVLMISILGELFLPIDYIDTPMGSYSLGPKGYSLYLIVVYSMVATVATIIRYRSLLSWGQSYVLLASAAIFAVIACIQIAFPYILLTDLGITLIVLSISISSEDIHMFINELGLYNELGCRKLLQEAVVSGKPFQIGVYAFLGQDEAIEAAMMDFWHALLPEKKYKVICGILSDNLMIVIPLRKSGNVYPLPPLPVPSDTQNITVNMKIMSFDQQDTVENILQAAKEFRTRFEENSLQCDDLTGLLRRAAFIRQVEHILKAEQSFTFLMIDLDDFKQVNDKYGHGVGDELLSEVACILRSSLRSTDIICRMGGDEFGVLLNGVTTKNAVIRIANQLQTQVDSIRLSSAPQLRVTLSIGAKISLPSERGRTFSVVYAKADEALYQSKNTGKDRLTISK